MILWQIEVELTTSPILLNNSINNKLLLKISLREKLMISIFSLSDKLDNFSSSLEISINLLSEMLPTTHSPNSKVSRKLKRAKDKIKKHQLPRWVKKNKTSVLELEKHQRMQSQLVIFQTWSTFLKINSKNKHKVLQ